MPRVAATLSDKSSTYYQVETTYPTDDESNKDRFSSYYRTSYVSIDDTRELLVRTRPDLFPEDEMHGRDVCAFKTYEPARRLADFLTEKGRFRSAFTGQEDWRKKYDRPIRARVVLVSSRTTRHELVDPKPDTIMAPLPEWLWPDKPELRARLQKYVESGNFKRDE